MESIHFMTENVKSCHIDDTLAVTAYNVGGIGCMVLHAIIKFLEKKVLTYVQGIKNTIGSLGLTSSKVPCTQSRLQWDDPLSR